MCKVCDCVEWLMIGSVAAEALEHNAVVSDEAEKLHEALRRVVSARDLEDLEAEHMLLQGYVTELMAGVALSSSLNIIRDQCDVDVTAIRELMKEGFEAEKRKNGAMARDKFIKTKMALLNTAQDLCGLPKTI